MTTSQSKKHRKGKSSGAKANNADADSTQRNDGKKGDLDDEPNSGFANYLKSNQGE